MMHAIATLHCAETVQVWSERALNSIAMQVLHKGLRSILLGISSYLLDF
jgi:hypothetical protein